MHKGILKTLVSVYRRKIVENFASPGVQLSGITYWQNRIFCAVMIYVMPLSLLAIIPGVIMSLLHDLFFLAAFDTLVLFLFMAIAFVKGISMFHRKLLFIGVFYAVAIVLLYFLGSFGPGLLYLLAATVFTILIFSRRAAYWSVVANALICAAFALAISFEMISGPLIKEYTMGAWIAVSSNLIILSAIITALLPTIFNGLQITINEQQYVRSQLKSEQKLLEKNLKHTQNKNQELEEFAYMASHDLKEPLRMITSFLTLLEQRSAGQLDEKSMEFLRYSKDGAERMKGLISNLLDYSLANKRSDERVPVDVNQLISAYVEEQRHVLNEIGATVEWEHLPTIVADKLALEQIFQNLISNALKYQEKGRKPLIKIDCHAISNQWQFSVSDNGIGIPDDKLEEIFVVFKRLHDRSQFPGTGIGLAICRKLVEKQNGRIWVSSRQGEGSTFYFALPDRNDSKSSSL